MLLVQSVGAQNSGSSGSVAFTSNVTAGNLLIVIFLPYNTNPSTPTDSLSNTWVNVAPFIEGPGNTGLKAWVAIANSSAACTVSYSGFPSGGEAAIFLEEWSGVEAAGYAGGTTGNASTTVVENTFNPLTTQTGIAVLFAWQDSDTTSISVSPGTSRQTVTCSTGAFAALADTPVSIQSSLGTFSVTWSVSSGLGKDTAAAMIFLFPQVSGGSAANSSFAS